MERQLRGLETVVKNMDAISDFIFETSTLKTIFNVR